MRTDAAPPGMRSLPESIGMPEIDDQHDPRLRGLVPSLVLHRIVEDDASTFLPVPGLASYFEAAVPSGILIARWQRNRRFVGPRCGLMRVPGLSFETYSNPA